MADEFTKVVRPGTLATYNGGRYSVFCAVRFRDGKLSITGVEGPTRGGNAVGACGQIEMHLDGSEDFNFAAGWDRETWQRFLAVWRGWHLNDMRAECEHQRALGWKYDTHRGQHCPECGYEIGTAWKFERVPDEVLEFLRGLPDTDREPAWV